MPAKSGQPLDEFLARSLFKSGKYDQSLSVYLKLAGKDERIAQVHFGAARCLLRLHRLDEAIDEYRIACQLKPRWARALAGLGYTLSLLRHYNEALAVLERARLLAPLNAFVLQCIGNCRVMLGYHEEGIRAYKQAIRISSDPGLVSGYLWSLHYDIRVSPQALYREHVTWSRVFLPRNRLPAPLKARPVNRRLRVGYVSADFHRHPVASFIENTIRHHDRSRFEIFCYYNSSWIDSTTNRFEKAADHWRSIFGVSDREACRIIRSDRIDILVDLSGHSDGNRLRVFGRNPAAVQISYLGYPGTTGLATMNYRIADDWSDPPGHSDQQYTEQLIRLPGGFACYTPPSRVPGVSPLPAGRNGYVTFGSFNHLAKLNARVIRTWCSILKRVPASRLLLKNLAMIEKETRDNVESQFRKHGIAPERLILLPPERSPAHLKDYGRMDIALDTFPWNGHTTACEALWMGVPVIALKGNSHQSRTVFSVLSVLDLQDLAAQSEREYVRLAVALAGNRNKLRVLRKTLRTRMKNSPLTDSQEHTKELEEAYRFSWLSGQKS